MRSSIEFSLGAVGGTAGRSKARETRLQDADRSTVVITMVFGEQSQIAKERREKKLFF